MLELSLSSGQLQPLTKMNITQEKIEFIGQNLVIARAGNRSLCLLNQILKDCLCKSVLHLGQNSNGILVCFWNGRPILEKQRVYPRIQLLSLVYTRLGYGTHYFYMVYFNYF